MTSGPSIEHTRNQMLQWLICIRQQGRKMILVNASGAQGDIGIAQEMQPPLSYKVIKKISTQTCPSYAQF